MNAQQKATHTATGLLLATAFSHRKQNSSCTTWLGSSYLLPGMEGHFCIEEEGNFCWFPSIDPFRIWGALWVLWAAAEGRRWWSPASWVPFMDLIWYKLYLSAPDESWIHLQIFSNPNCCVWCSDPNVMQGRAGRARNQINKYHVPLQVSVLFFLNLH